MSLREKMGSLDIPNSVEEDYIFYGTDYENGFVVYSDAVTHNTPDPDYSLERFNAIISESPGNLVARVFRNAVKKVDRDPEVSYYSFRQECSDTDSEQVVEVVQKYFA